MASKKQTYAELTTQERNELPQLCDLAAIPVDLVQEFHAFVFGKNDEGVKIAAVDPDNHALRAFVKKRFGNKAEWFLAKPHDVESILKDASVDFGAEISHLCRPELGTNGNIIEIVDRILRHAIKEKASDIHIEPSRNETTVRFRVDGMLQKMTQISKELHPAIVARFKILANLKIDEYRRPQDGRIEMEAFTNTSFRISVIPMLYGEKVVLRILDDSHKNNTSIRNLGFSKEHERILVRNIEKPFGMIVTSGPTGSGKTTTLYELLGLLETNDINISTLEDPIEYALPGVNQIQIDPRVGLTFATGLRSLLRQDPDVIMVGEIRDSETAIMATNSALTGHLVFTTMHTNDAPSALTRFLEMKVEDFVVASTVNLVIAQRLVRKVCEHCAKAKKLDATMLKKIEEREDIMKRLAEMGKNLEDIKKGEFRSGAGCEKCLETGYHGRIGIFELMEVDRQLQKLVLEHATADRLKTAALESGFSDMIKDGLEKVFDGRTTFDEILRTTRNV